MSCNCIWYWNNFAFTCSQLCFLGCGRDNGELQSMPWEWNCVSQRVSCVKNVAGSSELVTAEPVDLQGRFRLAICGCGSVPGHTCKLGKFIFGISLLFTFLAFHLPFLFLSLKWNWPLPCGLLQPSFISCSPCNPGRAQGYFAWYQHVFLKCKS